MYKIYFANLGKAVGNPEIGKRPVVSVEMIGENKVKVYKVTSRNKNDKNHVRMNNYIIHGYCDTSKYYIINKKYLMQYERDCTSSEENAIREKTTKRK